jgi:cation-transporting ATPase E
VLWLRRRRQDSIPEQAAWRNVWADISQIQGLSEAEAEARRLEVEDTLTKPRISSSTGDIWRRNLLSIFNLNLIGLSIALLLLGQPKDALTSAAGALFGIVLGVRQQLVARNQLEQFAAATRPEATVIRGGKVRTINPFNVVRGDVLLVGPGDQIFADGQVIGERSVVVEESVLTGKGTRITKGAGDTLRAGSFCVEGRAAFQVKQVGGEGFAETLSDKEPENQADLTPLQALMERILRILLVVVAVFVVATLVSYFFEDTGLLTATYEDYVSMAFGIAPLPSGPSVY